MLLRQEPQPDGLPQRNDVARRSSATCKAAAASAAVPLARRFLIAISSIFQIFQILSALQSTLSWAPSSPFLATRPHHRLRAQPSGSWHRTISAVGSAEEEEKGGQDVALGSRHPLSRRDVLRASGAAAAAFGPAIAAAEAQVGESATFDDDDGCRVGALAPERAIPGAYRQECMALPLRRLPVRVGGRGAEENATYYLEFEQDGSAVGAGSTGLAVWNSSILLQRLLERLAASSEPSFLHGKSIVELGCGVGVGSLTCAVLGAQRVYATDGNQQVLQLAQRNVERNGLHAHVTTHHLPWGLLSAMDFPEVADVIVGADLTYSPGSWRALAETMVTVLAPSGFVLYLSLGHAGFDVNAEVDGFLSVAREQGLMSRTPSDAEWPFSSTATDSGPLSDLVLQQCTHSPNERAILEETGGVRVVVLTRKRFQKL